MARGPPRARHGDTGGAAAISQHRHAESGDPARAGGHPAVRLREERRAGRTARARAMVGRGRRKCEGIRAARGRGPRRQARLATSRRRRAGGATRCRGPAAVGSGAAITTAILIGDRAGLDQEVEERLQRAGTFHVIAISGGNIAILTALILGLLRLVGLSPRTCCLADDLRRRHLRVHRRLRRIGRPRRHSPPSSISSRAPSIIERLRSTSSRSSPPSCWCGRRSRSSMPASGSPVSPRSRSCCSLNASPIEREARSVASLRPILEESRDWRRTARRIRNRSPRGDGRRGSGLAAGDGVRIFSSVDRRPGPELSCDPADDGGPDRRNRDRHLRRRHGLAPIADIAGVIADLAARGIVSTSHIVDAAPWSAPRVAPPPLWLLLACQLSLWPGMVRPSAPMAPAHRRVRMADVSGPRRLGAAAPIVRVACGRLGGMSDDRLRRRPG